MFKPIVIGGFRVTINEEPITAFESDKVRALQARAVTFAPQDAARFFIQQRAYYFSRI